MAKYNKPNSINTIWAVNALAQDLEKPTDSYIRTGWTQVKPPYEYENWSMNKLHQGMAYLNQLGIPEWDMNTEYQAYKSYVQGSDNRLYRCIQTHANRDPVAGNTAYWEVHEGNRQATTARRGTVELATQSEVNTGNRNDLAVTPRTLQNKKASQSAEGILRFATNAEVASGSRSDVALSPATLQFRAATTSQTGLVELATEEEALAGTRNDIALTPQSIVGIAQMFFPVGSIIMRPTDPGLSISNGGLGFGTWQKISGRSIIGDGSHTDSNGENRSFVAGQSEGTYRHRLSTKELPSHNHSASSGSAGGHSHSLNINSAGSHSHSGSARSAGAHSHTLDVADGDSGGLIGSVDGGNNNSRAYRSGYIGSAGAHTHSLSITNSGSHTHSGSTNTTGAHTHSITINSTGGNNYHNNLHPVFVAPIWYRTA